MITILYLYYNQPEAIPFLEQLNAPEFPVNFLFIDDASKIPLQLNWPNATVIRIKEDIPWNQPYANNLAFQYLYKQNPKTVLLRMDLDHYFMPWQVEILSDTIKPQKKEIIFFKRENRQPHPNIYMANVSDIIEAGGYNLQFSGNYGYDDKELIFRLKNQKFTFTTSNLTVKINHLLKTPNLNRDKTINQQKYLQITGQK